MNLQQRIQKLEQRGPDPETICQAVSAWQATGEIPEDLPPRVREPAQHIAELIESAGEQFEILEGAES